MRFWSWLDSSHTQLSVMTSTDAFRVRRCAVVIPAAVRVQRSARPRSIAFTGGGISPPSTGMHAESRSVHSFAAARSRRRPKTSG